MLQIRVLTLKETSNILFSYIPYFATILHGEGPISNKLQRFLNLRYWSTGGDT